MYIENSINTNNVRLIISLRKIKLKKLLRSTDCTRGRIFKSQCYENIYFILIPFICDHRSFIVSLLYIANDDYVGIIDDVYNAHGILQKRFITTLKALVKIVILSVRIVFPVVTIHITTCDQSIRL